MRTWHWPCQAVLGPRVGSGLSWSLPGTPAPFIPSGHPFKSLLVGAVSREPSFKGLWGTRASSEIPCGAEISGKRQMIEKGCPCGRKWVGKRDKRQAEKGRSRRDREGQDPGRQYSLSSCVWQAESSVTCHRERPEYHTEGQELDEVSGGTGEPRVCPSECGLGQAGGQRK